MPYHWSDFMVFGCGCILLWCLSRSMGSSSSAPVLSKESQAIKEEVLYFRFLCMYSAEKLFWTGKSKI